MVGMCAECHLGYIGILHSNLMISRFKIQLREVSGAMKLVQQLCYD